MEIPFNMFHLLSSIYLTCAPQSLSFYSSFTRTHMFIEHCSISRMLGARGTSTFVNIQHLQEICDIFGTPASSENRFVRKMQANTQMRNTNTCAVFAYIHLHTLFVFFLQALSLVQFLQHLYNIRSAISPKLIGKLQFRICKCNAASA